MSQPSQTLLHIDASMRGDDSHSRTLSGELVAALKPGQVVRRDLLTHPVPLIDADWIGANFTPAESRSAEQMLALSRSDQLVAELQQSDTLVIGLPMYNFGVPAALKAWIDQICRAGLTFRYGEQGPEGLLSGKKAYLLIATGGVPIDSEMDFVTPYLRQVLGFVGIVDVTVIAAEAMDRAPERLASVRTQIEALAA